MIKRSKLGDFKLSRYSKPTSCMKLKENDLVIDAFVEEKDTLFLTTDSGYGLSFKTEEVPIVGVKAAGVKAMKLKDDHLVSINEYSMEEAEYISIITDKGTGKRVHLSEFELSTRARRGLLVMREVKSNPYHVIKTFITDSKNYIGIKNGEIETSPDESVVSAIPVASFDTDKNIVITSRDGMITRKYSYRRRKRRKTRGENNS